MIFVRIIITCINNIGRIPSSINTVVVAIPIVVTAVEVRVASM